MLKLRCNWPRLKNKRIWLIRRPVTDPPCRSIHHMSMHAHIFPFYFYYSHTRTHNTDSGNDCLHNSFHTSNFIHTDIYMKKEEKKNKYVAYFAKIFFCVQLFFFIFCFFRIFRSFHILRIMIINTVSWIYSYIVENKTKNCIERIFFFFLFFFVRFKDRITWPTTI